MGLSEISAWGWPILAGLTCRLEKLVRGEISFQCFPLPQSKSSDWKAFNPVVDYLQGRTEAEGRQLKILASETLSSSTHLFCA
jgi:hypothetical protein